VSYWSLVATVIAHALIVVGYLLLLVLHVLDMLHSLG
jgi:hypothetical protein